VELAMYNALNLCQPSIPPRSILYQLPPIGIGTHGVESLTSYINRLADAHCLTPGALIVEMIAPQVKSGLVRQITSRGLNTLFNRSHTLNGTGELAYNFTQTLEALTLRNDLRSLTLLNWSDVLLTRGFMRIHKAWCPQCYHEWRVLGKNSYDPLLWSIASVTVCHVHQESLQDICPHCHQNDLPLLTWQSRNAYCSRCSGLLSSNDFIPKTKTSNVNSSRLDRWNLFVVESLGDLVGFTSSSHYPSKSQVHQKILTAINKTTAGNIAAFAKLLNLPKNTVWGWYQNKSFPPIDSLLKIIDLLNLSLLEFLLNDIDTLDLDIIGKTGVSKKIGLKRKSPQKFNSLLVQETLLDMLDKPEDLVLSIQEISSKLGYDRRLLTRHFPDLCREIVLKRTQAKKSSHLKTIEDCCHEVRTVTLTISERGEYPTEALVSQSLSKPSFLRYQQVRSAFKDAQREVTMKTSSSTYRRDNASNI
jgi:transcriptional regulator with XRE-family HTH domain